MRSRYSPWQSHASRATRRPWENGFLLGVLLASRVASAQDTAPLTGNDLQNGAVLRQADVIIKNVATDAHSMEQCEQQRGHTQFLVSDGRSHAASPAVCTLDHILIAGAAELVCGPLGNWNAS